jgi:RNA polymerase sigma-70 factor (ECF subfamily)
VAVPDLETVFRRHFDDVYRMAARLMGPGASSADLDDVAQQVFITIERALPRFRGESKLETWLYGVTSRVVLSELRRFGRQRKLKSALELEPTDVFERGTPEHSALDRETLREIWKALMKVKPKKRIVFVLHDVEERSASEIATLLEIPEATVRSRLLHARNELAATLTRRGLTEVGR